MRRIAVFAVLLVAAFAGPASADDSDYGGTINPKGDPVVWVSEPGADPVGTPGGTGSVECYLYNVTDVFVGDNVVGIGTEPEPNPEEGHGYLLVCYAVPSGDIDLVQIITYQPGVNIITPGSLANQALKELPLLYPRPRMAPPTTVKQVVGIRTWMWVDPADWRPISATAAIPGLAATVTATPTKTIWDMGDGATVICNGPGTVYDPSGPDAEQHSDCSHTYQHDGTYDVRATIVWSVTWTATNGASGNLGLVQRSTQFAITVEQRQAVING
ncbi:MAG: hypothetical protein QOI95_3655 [Acidimicrobiaceae bacterium]|jgi:hypothetical protein